MCSQVLENGPLLRTERLPAGLIHLVGVPQPDLLKAFCSVPQELVSRMRRPPGILQDQGGAKLVRRLFLAFQPARDSSLDRGLTGRRGQVGMAAVFVR